MGNIKIILEKIDFKEHSLHLPKKEICYKHIMEAYGGLHLIANYVGLNKPYYFFKKPTFWQHGWIPDVCEFHPLAVCGEILSHGKMSKDPTYLVGKTSNELYLKKHDYKNTVAVGLPLVYLPKREIKRVKNTLLVMPVHSLSYVKHEHWNFQDYVDRLLAIKNDFDKIVVCVHPSCIDNGYWVKEFLDAGFEVVEGVCGGDKNAFQRLQLLLETFEYVTTNGFGSHLAYAAYFGAKISIFGNFAEHKVEDYADMYKTTNSEEYNQMHKHFCQLTSEKSLHQIMAFLFYGHPKEAIQMITWGKIQVGFEAKKTPKQIRQILGWDVKNRIKYFTSYEGIKSVITSFVPLKVKEKIKTFYNFFNKNL